MSTRLLFPASILVLLGLVACGASKSTPATASNGGGGGSGGASSSGSGGGSSGAAENDHAGGGGDGAATPAANPAEEAARACSTYSFSDDPHPGDAHKQQENACLAIRASMPAATALLESRCNANDKDACHALGMIKDKMLFWYVEGLSLPPCSQSTDCWSFLVAEWNQPFEGTTPDAAAAQQLFEKSCNLGRADACEDVARLVADADKAKATTYYRKACDMGRAGACAFAINAEMKKTLPDPLLFTKSLEAFKKACDEGSSSGCNDAGVLLATGRGASKDVKTATELLDKGCGMGGASACGNLVYVTIRNGMPKDKVPDFGRGQPVLKQACDDGDGRACHALGWMLKKGIGVAADPAAGQKLIDKACSEGAACPK